MAIETVRQELEAKIVERADQDAAFRSRLVSNPTDTLFEEFNVSIPQNAKVTVLEESADNFYLILPHPTINEEKLTEDQLAMVAGGAMSGCRDVLVWTLCCTD